MGSSDQGSSILTQMEQEMDELSQMRYTADFSTDINTKMQIPERLSMGPDSNQPSGLMTPPDDSEEQIANSPAHAMMNVPDRIIVGGSNSHLGLKQGPMTMNIEDISPYPSAVDANVGLTTPPHTLTLEEYNFPTAGNETIQEDETPKRRGHRNTAITRNDSLTLGSLDGNAPLDLYSLQRHINLLNRKVAILEQESATRERNDTYLYSLLLIYTLYKGVRFLQKLF